MFNVVRRAVVIGNGFAGAENQSLGLVPALGLADRHTIYRSGLSRFYFTNKSPYHETIDFDVHIAHFSYFDQHAKKMIGKLEEALYNNIQFEQHWLEAQTDCQVVVNDEGVSRRAIHKALFESAAVIGASVLQVYILHHLFERKLGSSRI